MNYKNLLTVQPVGTPGTRVTKVVKKDYGYRIQMFNNYVTLFYIKLIINSNGTAKAQYRVEKNYHSAKRYTLYFGLDGEEVTRKDFNSLRGEGIPWYKDFNIYLGGGTNKFCAYNPIKGYFINPLFDTVQDIRIHIDNLKY